MASYLNVFRKSILNERVTQFGDLYIDIDNYVEEYYLIDRQEYNDKESEYSPVI